MIQLYRDLPVVSFKSKDEFYEWLSKNHSTRAAFWLRYFKKNSQVPTIVHTDAVDVALCWGWIDGLINKYDEDSYVVRFTPRRAKSVWSKVNVEKVAKLVAEGVMMPEGLAHVNTAKADGRWGAAYHGQSSMQIPAEVLALVDEMGLQDMFKSLPKSDLYTVYFKYTNAKRAETKTKIAQEFVAKLKAKTN